jgi:acyl carrier protein
MLEQMANVETIAGVLNELRPEFDFTASEDFIDAGMLDSHDMIMLVCRLEQLDNISIPGVDIVPENFSSLAAIHDLMNRCANERPGKT